MTTKTRDIIFACVAVVAFIVFVIFTPEYKPETTNQTIQLTPKKSYTYKSHTYVLVSDVSFGSMLIHEPDCSCGGNKCK